MIMGSYFSLTDITVCPVRSPICSIFLFRLCIVVGPNCSLLLFGLCVVVGPNCSLLLFRLCVIVGPNCSLLLLSLGTIAGFSCSLFLIGVSLVSSPGCSFPSTRIRGIHGPDMSFNLLTIQGVVHSIMLMFPRFISILKVRPPFTLRKWHDSDLSESDLVDGMKRRGSEYNSLQQMCKCKQLHLAPETKLTK